MTALRNGLERISKGKNKPADSVWDLPVENTLDNLLKGNRPDSFLISGNQNAIYIVVCAVGSIAGV